MKKYLYLLLFITKLLFSEQIDMVSIYPSDPDIPPFQVAKTAVTQELFKEIMTYNRSVFSIDTHPVESVSWYEALVFCNLLSVSHNLEPVYIYHRKRDRSDAPLKDVYEWMAGWGGIASTRNALWDRITIDESANGYRLLHMDEWEYLYDRLSETIKNDIENYAWIYSNSENRTHPVGAKLPDNNGLYDFLGNVKEWLFEERGHLGERYFRYNTDEQESFYNSLGYKKFNYREFVSIPNDNGLRYVTRNSVVGFRIARN